ncbi:MAG TPA: hypothetical protein VF796_20760, partial [Humisphaera sp.]
MSSPAPISPDLARRFKQAVDAGRLEAAERLLAELPSPVPAEACLTAGRLHASVRRWAAAAECLARVPDLDNFGRILLNLSRNLAEVEAHRPDLYPTLLGAVDRGRYSLGGGVGGVTTIVVRTDAGPMGLAPGNDPVAAVRKAMAPATGYAKGAPLGLLGIGDGHVLNAVSRNPPKLFMDQQQVVHVLEPDPQLVLTCLMAHDYTGDAGPIRQRRVRWYVGPDCAADYGAALLAEPMLPAAVLPVGQGEPAAALAAGVRAAHERLAQVVAAAKRAVHAHYATVGRSDVAAALDGRLGRRPRVLFLTTRLTTVLQYSTRDAADAARAAGWDAEVFIELEPYHGWTHLALMRAIDGFRPDVLFQLDHLRHETGDLFPPGLPFVCWIQDHLANLTSAAAGAAVAASPTDFVLVEYPFGYVKRFGYPADRCMALPKLTRPSARPARWANDGEDLVYVSNASASPEHVVAELLKPHAPGSHAHRLLAEAAGRVVATYRDGGSLTNRYEVQAVADAAAADLGLQMPKATREQIGLALAHPLNNLLYRQQALGWSAAAAADLGLSLGIYGKGWEKHPTLAAHARGPVGYGRELEELTRRSKVNLQVVPFACTHQRLLDGLAAGGFFLVRLSRTDILIRRLHAFLARAGLPESIDSREAAFAALDNHGRAALEVLLADAGPIGTSDLIDPVELVRSAEASGLLTGGPQGGELVPHLDRTGFTD